MLVITRRINEAFLIGDVVKVTVLGTEGRQVRIGIEAPKDVPIHREEVYERIKAEKSEAV